MLGRIVVGQVLVSNEAVSTFLAARLLFFFKQEYD